ncbi:MAG: DUF6492 family protein [Lachnospiraceae bacterium]|nr:DUF6492 family protein [Lachnospiraceae bacterium]
MDHEEYDALVVVTPKDYLRVERTMEQLVRYLPVRKIIYIGSVEVGEYVSESPWKDNLGFINENDLIPFSQVYDCMTKIMEPLLQGRALPRGIVGWYYQQFLKMEYARVSDHPYYMTWDGDTLPCGAFSMFSADGRPYFDMKHEYCEEYFVTMTKLFPDLHKLLDKSFISEHMLFSCVYMKALMEELEERKDLEGEHFWEKILHSIRLEHIQESSFSEFETYGTYMMTRHPEVYEYRNWHSFRYGGYFFRPEEMKEQDYQWLGKDFFAISFEKGHAVREDFDHLFNNPVYQQKMSARQMLEIAQEEMEGYKEVWEEGE